MDWTFSIILGSSSMLQFVQDVVALLSYTKSWFYIQLCISNALLGLRLIINIIVMNAVFAKVYTRWTKPSLRYRSVCVKGNLYKLLYKNLYGLLDIKKEFITWITGININIILSFKNIQSYYVMWIELSAIMFRTRVKMKSYTSENFQIFYLSFNI